MKIDVSCTEKLKEDWPSITTVDLFPACVAALREMQENADIYVGMIDCACDYIIESANTLSSEFKPAVAMGSLKNLRDLRKVIEMFNDKIEME